MVNRLVIGCLVWLLMVGVAAQSDGGVRATHPGRVLDVDDKPVAGCDVMFVTADGMGTGLQQDIVRTTSGKNGRYRVKLIPTRQYRAWAVAPASVLAEFVAVSDCVDLQMPMTTIRFGKPKKARESLRIRGVEAWGEHGEVRVETSFAGATGIVDTQVVHAGDRLRLPPLPANESLLELNFFVGDRFVHSEQAYSGIRVRLPQPFRIRARVVDEAGKPVANASIERTISTWDRLRSPFPMPRIARRFVVAETDKQGMAEWLVASRKNPFEAIDDSAMPFVARKQGFREAIAGFTEKVFSDGSIVPVDDKEPVVPFTLAKADAVTGVIRGAAKTSKLEWTGSHSLITGDRSFYAYGDGWSERLAADGAVRILPQPSTLSDRRLRLSNVTPVLEEGDRFAKVAVPRPLWLAGSRFEEAFTFDLTEVVPLRLRLLGPTGGPAMGAHVTVLSTEVQEDDPVAVPMRADAGGRLVAPVLPGRWFVLAMHDGAWSQVEIDIEAGHDVVELKLQPMPVMHMRVVDADGKPVEGATIRSGGAGWGGASNAVESIMQDFGSDIADWCMRDLRSDAEGNLDLPYLPVKGLRIDARVRSDGAKSKEFVLDPNEERIDVVLGEK